MKAVRFTKAEHGYLVELLEECRGEKTKLRETVLAKLEAAEMPVKKSASISVADALDAFRGVLGARLVSPPASAHGIFAQMARRLSALGMTRMMCTTVAKVAAVEWRGPVKAESLVRQADTLLVASQQGFWNDSSGAFKHPLDSGPVELNDDDI